MENLSLGEALNSAETATTVEATPDPAQVEQTPVTDQSASPDSSLIETAPGEQEQPKPEEQPKTEEQPSQAELDFKALREQKTTLENELSTFRQRIDTEFGGESGLSLIQPLAQKVLELPPPGANDEWANGWAGDVYKLMLSTTTPEQKDALQSYAFWDFMQDPVNQKLALSTAYGEHVTPEALQEISQLLKDDPYLLDKLRPEETYEQRLQREAQETREKERDGEVQRLKEADAKREAESQKFYTQQTMSGVFQVALAPRAEVKKQYGLEFQKTDKDTPEISAFKERLGSRYDRMVLQALSTDSELNRLANSAEYLAGQKDEKQRGRANSQFAPQMESRVRAVCAQVAKDLAQDLKLFSPELSDRTKAENLKDLPAQVLGGNGAQKASTGMDLSDMPDPVNDPVKFQAWVSRKQTGYNQSARTPGVLQAG